MLRTFISALAAGMLAVSLAACSAGVSGGQGGCSQPPVQQYAVPLLVTPSSGSTGFPDKAGTIQVQTTMNVIVGTLSLVSSSGTLGTGKVTLDAHQPSNGYLWDVKIPALKPQTTYTVTQTVAYPGACLGPEIIQTHNVGTFTSQ